MYGNTVARGEAKEPSSFERHAKVLEPSIPGEGVGMGVRACGHQPLTLVMSGPLGGRQPLSGRGSRSTVHCLPATTVMPMPASDEAVEGSESWLPQRPWGLLSPQETVQCDTRAHLSIDSLRNESQRDGQEEQRKLEASGLRRGSCRQTGGTPEETEVEVSRQRKQ